MIWTFLLGLAAGWAAPFGEDFLKSHLNPHLPGDDLPPADLRAIAVVLAVFIAAIIAALTGGGGAIALTLGAVVGVFGPRALEVARAARTPNYDD